MTDEEAALKEAVSAVAGYWHPFHEGMLQHAPRFLRGYFELNHATLAGHVPQHLKELIFLAIDATAAHLYEPGIRYHIWTALTKCGASKSEIFETLQIACSVVWHTQALAMSKLAAHVMPALPSAQSRSMEAIYRDKVGRWPYWANALYNLNSAYAEAFFRFYALPWTDGQLPAKEKALIYVAVNATPTVACAEELDFYIERALELGATPGEVNEAVQLSSAVAIHSCISAVPELMKTLSKMAETSDKG